MESYESFMCRREGGDVVLRQSHKPHSFGSSRAALSPGNTECSNYKLLTMKIKILEARLAMEKNPDDHPCESVAILHELLNEMKIIRVE
ncbi:hypothetical protein Tco_1264054 [Tanacetum coccineum]